MELTNENVNDVLNLVNNSLSKNSYFCSYDSNPLHRCSAELSPNTVGTPIKIRAVYSPLEIYIPLGATVSTLPDETMLFINNNNFNIELKLTPYQGDFYKDIIKEFNKTIDRQLQKIHKDVHIENNITDPILASIQNCCHLPEDLSSAWTDIHVNVLLPEIEGLMYKDLKIDLYFHDFYEDGLRSEYLQARWHGRKFSHLDTLVKALYNHIGDYRFSN